jgi:hypothetical protein
MGKSVSQDAQAAFYRVVHDRDVAKLAAQMGMSPGVLYNKANPTEGNHHKPTLADCIIITNLTGDKRIAQAFAASVGGVYHDLPDLSTLSTDALIVHLMRIQIRNGSFHHEIHESLSNDDKIDAKEFARIKSEAQEYIAMILESLARMREMGGG